MNSLNQTRLLSSKGILQKEMNPQRKEMYPSTLLGSEGNNVYKVRVI